MPENVNYYLQDLLEKYGYSYGRYSLFYDQSGISHTNFNRLLNRRINSMESTSIDNILKIIIFLGTDYEESRLLFYLYSDFAIDGIRRKSKILRAILKWLESSYKGSGNFFIRQEVIQDYLNENGLKIKII